MLGRKKGMRDINRGVEDIRSAWSQIKVTTMSNPEEKLAALQKQYDMHTREARTNRSKAHGLFNGPARLRMAQASEAKAHEVLEQIHQVQAEQARAATADSLGPATQRAPQPTTGVPPVEETLPKSHAVAIILSLFLGTLGIDRFYLGHVGLGVAKLLLSWMTVGVWQLIDLILIIAKGTRALRPVNWQQ